MASNTGAVLAVAERSCAICLRPFTDGNGDVCADCWDRIPEVGDRRLVHITPAVWSPAPQHRWTLTAEEWAAYPIDRWAWRSQYGALEFMSKRMVNGTEVYTPLSRPLERYSGSPLFLPVSSLFETDWMFTTAPVSSGYEISHASAEAYARL